MKTTTKTGRKIVGALVSAAVMISMIPAMVLAVPDPQTETVNITLDSIEGTVTSYADQGIIISASGSGLLKSGSMYLGSYNNGCDYSIAIDGAEGAAYAGGKIRSVTITTGTVDGSQVVSVSGDIEKNPVDKSGDTLTWIGNETSIAFTLKYSGGNAKDLPIISIAVEVEVPADGIQIITPTVPIPLIPDMSLTAYAEFLPANTTYTEGIVWSGDNDSVATVSADGIITPVGIGTITLTAS